MLSLLSGGWGGGMWVGVDEVGRSTGMDDRDVILVGYRVG